MNNDEFLSKCKDLIIEDEGFSSVPYKDINGNLTVGFGFNLESGIPIDICHKWIDLKVKVIEYNLSNKLSFWNKLNDARKYVMVNMAYNIGMDGFLDFKEMLNCLENDDYVGAEKEMANSLWNNEVPNRAKRLREIMIKGEFL